MDSRPLPGAADQRHPLPLERAHLHWAQNQSARCPGGQKMGQKDSRNFVNRPINLWARYANPPPQKKKKKKKKKNRKKSFLLVAARA